jgi:hypothetical protein
VRRWQAFYEQVTRAAEEGDEAHAWPVLFMPTYYGDSQHEGRDYVHIENLMEG